MRETSTCHIGVLHVLSSLEWTAGVNTGLWWESAFKAMQRHGGAGSMAQNSPGDLCVGTYVNCGITSAV